MDRASAEQQALTGTQPCAFRPPGGNYNATTLSLAQQRRMKFWTWSVDTEDWKANGSSSGYWVNRIISLAEQEGRVLQHPVVLIRCAEPWARFQPARVADPASYYYQNAFHLPQCGHPDWRQGAAVGLVHPAAQRRRRAAAAWVGVHPHRGTRPGGGAGPARLRGSPARHPRPRAVWRARDGLRLVGGRDTAAAVSFLAGQPGVHTGKIAVLGESMGGEQALAAMGADPRIRAVVAEGATGQQLADHGWKPNGIGGILERGVEWVQYTTAGLLSGAPRPISIPDAIRAAAPRPALIIAGGAVPGEPVAARWFQAASPATVHVWVVPRAGHTQGLGTAPRAWESCVISFLNTALRPGTATAATAAANNG